MAQLNIAIEESRKEEWKREAEERERSLTSLIKTSVEAEIQGGHSSGGELGDDANEHLLEIVESVQAVEAGVTENTRRLGSLEDQLSTEPETRELADEIFRMLPSRERVENPIYPADHQSVAPPHKEEPPTVAHGVVQSGTPEDFAKATDSTVMDVQSAIDLLRDEIRMIGELDSEDGTRYYKEDS